MAPNEPGRLAWIIGEALQEVAREAVAPEDVMKTACWVVAEGEPRSLHL